ncbi:membrane protein [Microbacterium phage Kenzers]|nr:membrane protein [Microbacterium phage Kenzers]UVT31698.1 membrane protein [Microbacterium phage Kenzers]
MRTTLIEAGIGSLLGLVAGGVIAYRVYRHAADAYHAQFGFKV